MKLFDFGLSIGVILALGFAVGAILENHLGPEHWIEEHIVEPIIEALTGTKGLDITPGSPEAAPNKACECSKEPLPQAPQKT